MGRLTQAQLLTLSRMTQGGEVWTTGGLNSHAFWHNDIAARAPTHATLAALARAKLIEDRETVAGVGKKYQIADLGREALAAARRQSSEDGR